MTLLQQYIEKAVAHVHEETNDEGDFIADDAREWIEQHIDMTIKASRIVTLAAHVLNGDIRHCYEEGCPEEDQEHYAPTYGCNDEGCVACLIQRDFLRETLGNEPL